MRFLTQPDNRGRDKDEGEGKYRSEDLLKVKLKLSPQSKPPEGKS